MSEFRNSGNIFFNLPIPNPSYKKSVSSIVVGHCGVGKSRLVNNLCGSNQKVGICSGSLTQDLFCGDCKYSSNSYKTTFSIYDSPGVTPSD